MIRVFGEVQAAHTSRAVNLPCSLAFVPADVPDPYSTNARVSGKLVERHPNSCFTVGGASWDSTVVWHSSNGMSSGLTVQQVRTNWVYHKVPATEPVSIIVPWHLEHPSRPIMYDVIAHWCHVTSMCNRSIAVCPVLTQIQTKSMWLVNSVITVVANNSDVYWHRMNYFTESDGSASLLGVAYSW